MKSMTSKYILIITLILFIFKCSSSLNNSKEITPQNTSIEGFWGGLEPGSDDYRIVYLIIQVGTEKYTGTGYGFQNDLYVEDWNLDSVSYNPETKELYTYNESHRCMVKGIADFEKQLISGTIESYEINGPLVLKRTEDKELKGLYPRGETANDTIRYEYAQPEKIDDGWETATMEQEGVNSQLVIQGIEKIISQHFKSITSVLIVKNGKLVCEEYFYGYDKDKFNRLASCTKSVTSLLTGIAIDKGKIKDVNEKVFDFFPDYNSLKTEQNSEIQIKHLLTMTAGQDWDEMSTPYDHPENSLRIMSESDDYLKFILERPMIHTPGEQFNYSCACTILLGWILNKSTGMHADKYAELTLFKDLGITDYYWHKRDDGFPHVEGGLFLPARDMAKIGALVLNNGKWQGKQVVSEAWIEESTVPHIAQVGGQPGYGYQWWIMDQPFGNASLRGIMALGADPEKIIIIPALNAVIVTTGPFVFFNDFNKSPLGLIMQYIVPALI